MVRGPMTGLISVTNLIMITGERTYHRRRRHYDVLHIDIPGNPGGRAGAEVSVAAVALDFKGPSSLYLGAGRLRVWGFMLNNCGARGRLRGRLYRHSRLAIGKRQIVIARPNSRQGRRRQIATRK